MIRHIIKINTTFFFAYLGASKEYQSENDNSINHSEEDQSTGIFNWYPYKGLYKLTDDETEANASTCPERQPAIDGFPPGIWTRKSQKNLAL